MKSTLTILLAALSFASAALAQPTAFSYQGRLSENGAGANGSYDLRCALFDSAAAGNVVGTPIAVAPVAVSSGLFTVTLDFGASVFNGSARWLEIAVRTNGSVAAYSTLAPRQPINSTPYAIQALNAASAASAIMVTGPIADTLLSANIPRLTSNLVFSGAVTFNHPASSFQGSFSGNGATLTNVDLRTANATGIINWLTTNFTPSFSPAPPVGVGSVPHFAMPVDVNRDGWADLISANYSGNNLSVLTNNGRGGFVLAGTHAVGTSPNWVAAADANQDGWADLIGANSGAGTLTVLTNNGRGGFALAATLTVGNSPRAVVAADVNGDGWADLISANTGDGTLTVLTNNGAGGFRLASTPTVGIQPYAVTAADVNSDGRVDLISANFMGNTLTVLTNNGSGGFVLAASPAVGTRPYSVVAVDVNGDGKLDLISANAADGTLTVLTNNGSGGFASAATLTVGRTPISVAAADVNRDGWVDLISANYGDNTLLVLTNNRLGGFVAASTNSVGTGPWGVAAADVNGDGQIDLIAANGTDNTLSVLLNTQPPPVAAFIGNGSGLTGLPSTVAQVVLGSAVQAQPNTDYTATNATPVTVNLPATASVGDVVRVYGLGSGGWLAAPGAAQFISGYPPGVTWLARETDRNWAAVASSADGTKLVAVVSGGQIYTSTDSGVAWVARESNRAWRSVASSADGSKLVAAVGDGQIYVSTDSGASWTARESSRDWKSVASSADGSKLVAGYSAFVLGPPPIPIPQTTGRLAVSTDGGVTWTLRGSDGVWNVIASSADGTKLAAVFASSVMFPNLSKIRTSTDGGVTWIERGGFGDWKSVAASADGTRLVAVASGGRIYTSTDSGATWTARETDRNWSSVASSADGTKLVAVVAGGQAFTSTPDPLPGGQGSTVSLQYMGNDQWQPLNLARSDSAPNTLVTRDATGSFTAGTITAGSFVGNGSGLTALNASALASGTIPIVALGNAWKIGGNTGTAPSTDFIGTTDNQPLEFRVNGTRALRLEPNSNGAPNVIEGSPNNFVVNGLVGATIGGGGATNYSSSGFTNSVTGDFGTVGGGAHNTAYRYATVSGGSGNTARSGFATVGGGSGNSATSGFATVGGGSANAASGLQSVVGGGYGNSAESDQATVGGGSDNSARGIESFVGGGSFNMASGDGATVGGGFQNKATGYAATVGGGDVNTASGDYATVSGGEGNTAAGQHSFAAGKFANALHRGTFVWADYRTQPFSSTANDQFLIRANGGVGIGTSGPAAQLDVSSSGGNSVPQMRLDQANDTDYARLRFTVAGDYNKRWDIAVQTNSFVLYSGQFNAEMLKLDSAGLTVRGTLVSTSDRNAKENFAAVNPCEVLEKVAAMPITRWNYKGDADRLHLGPVAQDFRAAFGLGTDDKHIATVDADGVALAAIQGLNQKLEAKDAELQSLRKRLTELEKLVRTLAEPKHVGAQ